MSRNNYTFFRSFVKKLLNNQVDQLIFDHDGLDNAAAQAEEKVAKFLSTLPGQLRKTIVVKNKLVNLIVK